MITINKPLDHPTGNILGYELNQVLFFDIETTGFVADKSFLYLIGCCYHKEDEWHLIQWFSEGPNEEKMLLDTFISFLKNYRYLIHFNGTTFDLPYLTRKCKRLGISYGFEDLCSIDLYKSAFAMKKFLNLTSCTQKSVEAALSIHRDDQYSGGELIQVYANYLGLARLEKLKSGLKSSISASQLQQSELQASQSEIQVSQVEIPTLQSESPALQSESPALQSELPALQSELPALQSEKCSQSVELTAASLLNDLLLHNAEDVAGLIDLVPFLHYQALLDGNYSITDMYLDPSDQICFLLQPEYPVPLAFQVTEPVAFLQADKEKVLLGVMLYEGTLKLFLDNYKDYYYLPTEQTILHKSVASSVDKDYRIRATKDTCFLPKTALFLPQFDSFITPEYRKERKDKTSYFECLDSQLADPAFVKKYTYHILMHLMKKKKSSIIEPE